MSDTILDHDAIRSRIKSVIREAVGRWPTNDGVEKVLGEMIKERDRTGVYLTPVAKRALGEFRAACGLPGPHAWRRTDGDGVRIQIGTGPNALKIGASAVAIITLARETEMGRGGHGTAGRDGGAGF